MPRSSRVVLVLHADTDLHSSVTSATPHGTLISVVRDWESLAAAIKQTPPSTVSVVDPYFGAETGPALELRELLARLPSASIIAALPVEKHHSEDVALLDDWGVAGMITIGHDDTPVAIERRLADACARPLKRLLGRILPADTSAHAQALIFAATDTTCDRGGVGDFADALGASPSTLLRWAEEARLPKPRTLLQWMRILVATKLLEEQERDVDEIARAAGYASAAELRRVTVRHLGATPTELRSAAAFDLATSRFLAVLRPPST